MSAKKTHTITVSRMTDVKLTLPSYYDARSKYTYVFHEGEIVYDDGSTLEVLSNTLNYSLSQRTDEEKITYLKGLTDMVERTIKQQKRTSTKKSVTSKKK